MEEETTGAVEKSAPKRKGRGKQAAMDDERYTGKSGIFESLDKEGGSGPARSVEGWIIFITNVHEEAQEDDVLDKFSDFGEIKNINVNLDRRTGFVKGYALVEYEKKSEAEEAISQMDGEELLGQTVNCAWAFVKAGGRQR